MAGKRTGGGLPNGTIRRVARRSTIWGALDARRTAERDIQFDRFVRPRGPGGAIVSGPAGGQERYVSNPMGRTFKPGATVPTGSSSGEEGEFVIAGPPGGRRGSRPASKATRPYATFVAQQANQYAFGSQDDTFLALLYSDATYLSLRGTTPAGGWTLTGCILSDESETVGDGSAMMRDGSTVYVWDVEGDATYSYSAPSGWRVLTPLYYQNGALYWFEGEDVVDEVTDSFDIRLRTAETDLTSESTISTVTLDVAGAQTALGGSTIEYFLDTEEYAASLAVDSDGAVVYFGVRPQDGNGERTDVWKIQFRFLLAGGAPSTREWSSPERSSFVAATLGGSSFALAQLDPDNEYAVLSKADNASTAADFYWPENSLDGIAIASFNVGPNGSTLQVYSGPVDRSIYRGSASGTLAASNVQAFDSAPNYPSFMYYYGA